MQQSNRISKMAYSPIRKLSGFVEIAKEKGVNVLSLNIGQPDVTTPKELKDMLKSIDFDVLSYTDSRGDSKTISAFVEFYRKYNVNVSPNDIVLTNGGSEALLFSFVACCDSGDEILVPSPYYSNYNNFADIANVNLVPIVRSICDDFAMPEVSVFEEHVSSKTKAILICNPCNPTGVIYTPNEIRRILMFAEKHDLFVICDEVYRDFVYDENEPFSALSLGAHEDRLIIVDSLSKRFSACGSRMGVLMSKNVDLMQHVMKLCQSRLCVPYIEQKMSEGILQIEPSYLKDMCSIYEDRRNKFVDRLSKISDVSVSRPGGAFYVMLKLPVFDSEHFSKWLVSEFSYNGYTLLVAPASKFYGIEGVGLDEIRLSYCVSEDKLMLAADILESALKKYRQIYCLI